MPNSPDPIRIRALRGDASRAARKIGCDHLADSWIIQVDHSLKLLAMTGFAAAVLEDAPAFPKLVRILVDGDRRYCDVVYPVKPIFTGQQQRQDRSWKDQDQACQECTPGVFSK